MGVVSSIVQMIAACSVNTHVDTVRAVIDVESKGNPLAIGVNGPVKLRSARDQADAAQLARYAMSLGYSVDMGLMQINSGNLRKLGLTPEAVFDPCTNIRAGTMILSGNYANAALVHGEGQTALRASLSAYNTGSMTRGFRNGYVARYYAGTPYAPIAPVPGASGGAAAPIAADPFTATTSVFKRKDAAHARTRTAVTP